MTQSSFSHYCLCLYSIANKTQKNENGDFNLLFFSQKILIILWFTSLKFSLSLPSLPFALSPLRSYSLSPLLSYSLSHSLFHSPTIFLSFSHTFSLTPSLLPLLSHTLSFTPSFSFALSPHLSPSLSIVASGWQFWQNYTHMPAKFTHCFFFSYAHSHTSFLPIVRWMFFRGSVCVCAYQMQRTDA